MMDKNHDGAGGRESGQGQPPPSAPSRAELLARRLTGREAPPLSVILCTGAAAKTRFLRATADAAAGPVLYIDTDLLYAGCARAGLGRIRDCTTLVCPDQDTWHSDLASAMSASSAGRMTVIIDSLNGIYGMYGGADSAMTANTHIMALASLAGQAGSAVIVGARVRRRSGSTGAKGSSGGAVSGSKRTGGGADEGAAHAAQPTAATAGEWVLHPGGRQVPRMAADSTYLLPPEDTDAPPAKVEA